MTDIPAESVNSTATIIANHYCWRCSKINLDEHPDVKEKIKQLYKEAKEDLTDAAQEKKQEAKELKKQYRVKRDFEVKETENAENCKTKMGKGNCPECGAGMCRIISVSELDQASDGTTA